MINSFLQNGLKGIYICLDRPANEVRSQFKRLNIDIENYDQDYSLFFVDFFTYSQNALIESATLKTLEYKPPMLLNTLGPFLDWIKGGFIIIDTLSTLTLNMDSKEAYDFIRGLKLLGRAFNLISVGVMHQQMETGDSVTTNSDGNIEFKNGAVTLNNFERPHLEVLTVFTDKEGKIAFKSPTYGAGKENSSTPMLKVLANTKSLTPTLKLTSTHETDYIYEELQQNMPPLIKTNSATQTPHCSAIHCPTCNSYGLEFYLQCPECQNRVLAKGEILEHFKCGNIDFEEKFRRGTKIVCTKCNNELQKLGVDYRRVGVGYRCSNKHLFSMPKMVFICAQCRGQFDLNEGKLQVQFSYELTEKGKREAIQAGYRLE